MRSANVIDRFERSGASTREAKALMLRILEISGARGASVYDLSVATDLDAQGVLDLIAELKHDGTAIHVDLDYAGNLELMFFLDKRET